VGGGIIASCIGNFGSKWQWWPASCLGRFKRREKSQYILRIGGCVEPRTDMDTAEIRRMSTSCSCWEWDPFLDHPGLQPSNSFDWPVSSNTWIGFKQLHAKCKVFPPHKHGGMAWVEVYTCVHSQLRHTEKRVQGFTLRRFTVTKGYKNKLVFPFSTRLFGLYSLRR
jgi:hypothetical protein